MIELPPRQKFAELLAANAADSDLADCIPDLAADFALASAYLELRSRRPAATALLRRFSDALGAGRDARRAGWQHDVRRLRLRLCYRRTGAASTLLPPAFLAALTATFLKAGLSLALGLEKRPRPLLQLGHPLPQGAEGLEEYLEVVLDQPPPDPDPLPALNRQAVEGLEFLSCEALPDHASPVLDLCRRAEWRWPCPEPLRAEAGRRMAEFLAAEAFQIEKRGKEAGQKQVKRIEVRPLVLAMAWDGPCLRFETHIEPGHALHPAKLLAGILGLEPAQIQGLVRTRIHLAADPRLDQAERFEPKLKNMFEDAVLLKAGPNLQVFDDDDDEPLRLG